MKYFTAYPRVAEPELTTELPPVTVTTDGKDTDNSDNTAAGETMPATTDQVPTRRHHDTITTETPQKQREKIVQPFSEENISLPSRDIVNEAVSKQPINFASNKTPAAESSSENVEIFPQENHSGESHHYPSNGDLKTHQNDPSSSHHDVEYSVSTENTRMLAKVKTYLEEEVEEEVVGTISASEQQRFNSSLEPNTAPAVTLLPTAMQDDRNMTFISSEVLASSTASESSSNQPVTDYKEGPDYYDYYHPEYYYDYQVTSPREGHPNDVGDYNENPDDDEEETGEEQNFVNTLNDVVMTEHPVEIFKVVTEYNGEAEDAVIEEEIDDIHDEDTVDTPNNDEEEQEQYYDITDRPELNRHETSEQTEAKTSDVGVEECNEIFVEAAHEDEDNNTNDDNIEIATTYEESGHEDHHEITDNESALNSAPRIANHFNKDDGATYLADNDIDQGNTRGTTSTMSPRVHLESSKPIHHPLLTLIHRSSQSFRLLVTPSFHMPDSKVTNNSIQEIEL